MADNVENTSSKKDKKDKKKKKDSKHEEDSEIPSTSNEEVKDNKKKKKEKKSKKDKKSDGEEIPNASTSSEIPETKKKKDKKAKKGSKKEGDEIPSASASAGEMEVSSKDDKKNKKEKSKKNDKKNPKENSGNQAETEAENVPQFYSPAGVDYSGMQMDDFQENPSCFSKFSNPLKKKHGYDFETTLESPSINYQEVPVSIERAPATRQSVTEVTVTPKQDGSLPPVKQGPPLNQHVESGFTTYPENGALGQPKAETRKDEASTSSRNEVKKLEEKISELEKANKQHQVSLEEYKVQVTKASRDKEEVVERLTKELQQKANMKEPKQNNVRNQPHNMAQEFEMLCATSWVDAKSSLDQYGNIPEYDKLSLLCDVMLQAEEVCAQRYEDILEGITQQIHQPFGNTDSSEPGKMDNTPVPISVAISSKAEHNDIGGKDAVRQGDQAQFKDQTSTQPAAVDHVPNGFSGPDDSRQDHSDTADITKDDSKGKQDYAKDTGKGTDDVSDAESERQQSDDQYKDDQRYFEDIENDYDVADSVVVPKERMSEHEAAVDVPAVKDQRTLNKGPSSSVHQSHISNELYFSGGDANQNQRIEISKDLENLIAETMLKLSDEVEVTLASQFINDYVENKILSATQDGHNLEYLAPLHRYVTLCLRFAWKMAIQRPQLHFSTNGVALPWDGNRQVVCEASDNPNSKSAVVLLYLSPQLLQGDKLLVKGSVLIKEQMDSD